MTHRSEGNPVDVHAVRAAIRALKGMGEDEPELRHVLTLVRAALDGKEGLVPERVVDAVHAKFETDRDFANGGADQYVWNQGPEAARAAARALRRVGAIENADLLERLATELVAFTARHAPADPVQDFLAYRRGVGGPFFAVPDIDEEVGEALLEHVIAHADELPDPDAPLPGF
jgi:hypothetical protein